MRLRLVPLARITGLLAALSLLGAGPRVTDDATVRVVPTIVQPGGTAKIVLRLPALAGAHSAFLHYGFNGWNIPLSGAGAGQAEDTGDINYYRHAPMAAAGPGVFELAIAVPTEARALHFVVCWDACGNGQWDNNGGHDYSWPIAFPYIGPVLSWDETVRPDDGLVVTFMTSVPAASWLRFGLSDDQTGQTLHDDGGERHSFALRGLAPDTNYWYEVGSTDGLVSARFAFKTAKPKTALARMSFAIYADAQDNGETGTFAATVAELVRNHTDLDFVLVAGDMPWNDKPGAWWTYFDKARALLATKVVMPVLGNHDTPGVGSSPDQTSFERLFNLPRSAGSGYFYEFDFGPTRLLALDSERMLDFAQPGGGQYRWLQGRLAQRRQEVAASSEPLWTFTYWHIPPYNAGARHWTQQFDYRAVTRDFAGVIDWDFSGHEHLGQRFKPLRYGAGGAPQAQGRYGAASDAGVGFLVVPAAGAVPEGALVANAGANDDIRDLMAYPIDPTQTQIAPFNGFERVDIDGAQIRLRMFGASRAGDDASRGFYVRDEVSYRK